VQTLDMIVRDAESVPPVSALPLQDTHLLSGHGLALCEAAVTLAEHGEASAIVAITRGGKTARVLSALRPKVPVFAATDRLNIARRLALVWGVVPLLLDLGQDIQAVATDIGRDLVARGVIAPSSPIVLVSITPDLAPGPSNFLKIQRV
jgi:pyruvate kinase